MTFGEKLRKYRTEKRLSQAELAKLAGLGVNTISNYESGKTYPQNREVYKTLAEILGVDPDHLHNENDDFVEVAQQKYGYRGKKQAMELVCINSLLQSDDIRNHLLLSLLYHPAAQAGFPFRISAQGHVRSASLPAERRDEKKSIPCAGSNEKNENVGAGRDGACTGSKQGKNSGLKRTGKQSSEPRKDEHDNVRAEEESQDKKNTCGSYDTGDLNADSSRGESDSLTAFNELLKEMEEYKEATVDEEIKKKYSNTVCEAIERIANGIETERFEKIVNCCKCVENFLCEGDIKRLEADCEKRKEADKQKESVLKSMTSFKAFIEWYCEKGKQVNWRGECIDRLRKNIQENVCVDCSVKDLMHAAQFVSGKYDIYEDQTVYDAVKLIIENGLVSIKVNKNKTLDDIREELLYLRYLKPEEGDDYKIKCLTEGYLAGSSGKKNSMQEEKIVNQGPDWWRKWKEKLPCRKKTDGNSGNSSPFEIKLGIALDLIRKIEVSLNGDNARSGDSDSREAPDETSQFSGCSSRKNDASTWDECKNAQLKESCIRMLKECNLNENEKTELRRIENELRTEPGRSADRDHDTKSSNIRLIVILISLVLILSFAGIYLYNYFFAEDEEPIPTQPPATAQPTATTQPTVEPTVDPRESEWAKQLMKASIYMQKAQAERRKESKEFSRNSERLTSAPESNEPVTTAGSQQ